jgi:hypothetical protein
VQKPQKPDTPANALCHLIVVFDKMQEAGYDLGQLPSGPDALKGLGEALLKTLKGQEEPRTVSRGIDGIKALGAGE